MDIQRPQFYEMVSVLPVRSDAVGSSSIWLIVAGPRPAVTTIEEVSLACANRFD